MVVHLDCRQYRPTEPCPPHKQTRVRCQDCTAYDPIAERIAIVKLGALGDVLRTTSCLAPLKGRYPRSHVTWITRGNAVPLLDRNPAIDRVLSIDGNYVELLLAESFDLTIAPDAEPFTASIASLVRSGVKHGFVADGRGGVNPLNVAARAWWEIGIDDGRKQSNRRTYGEWLYAMCDLPIPVARPSLQLPPGAVERARRRLHRASPAARRWIGFNTGASGRWEQKRWKPEYYPKLARMIEAADPESAIVLLGGPDEAALNRRLRAEHPTFIDGGTDNSIDDFAALVAACEWLITGDSLGYHVACAVGTPAMCLVGPTSPWELDAYADNCIVHAPLECISCYLSKCPFTRTCMDALSPDVIWERLLRWKSSAAASNVDRSSVLSPPNIVPEPPLGGGSTGDSMTSPVHAS